MSQRRFIGPSESWDSAFRGRRPPLIPETDRHGSRRRGESAGPRPGGGPRTSPEKLWGSAPSAPAQACSLLLVPVVRLQRVVFRLALELDRCHFERFAILARTSAQGVPLGPSRSSLSSRRSSSSRCSGVSARSSGLRLRQSSSINSNLSLAVRAERSIAGLATPRFWALVAPSASRSHDAHHTAGHAARSAAASVGLPCYSPWPGMATLNAALSHTSKESG